MDTLVMKILVLVLGFLALPMELVNIDEHGEGITGIETTMDTEGIRLGYCGYEPTYTDEEYKWFAKHSDILILHENHRDKIDFIKSINPKITLLCYKFAGVDRLNAVGCGGDFSWIDRNHPEWFLLDRSGNRITDPYNEYSKENVYFMDFGNPGWRHYISNDFIKTVKSQGWDGVFLDGVYVNIGGHWTPNGLLKYGSDEEFNEAVIGFLSTTYLLFQESGKLMIPNACECVKIENSWETWLNFSDGGLDEGFVSISLWSPTDVWRDGGVWERQISYLEYTGNQGKIFYATSQGRRLNTKDLLYGLSSYLLGRRGEMDVFYNAAGELCSYKRSREDYEFFRDYYNAPIGTPLGRRYKSQGVWQRGYSNGRVLVNPSPNTYFISLDKEYVTVENTVLTNITLNGHEGIILLNH